MMTHGKSLHMVTWILVIVGGLNWLLQGIFGWEVGQIFGGMDAVVSRVIYILVGLSAIYEICCHGKSCRYCKPEGGMQGGTGQQS